MYDRIEKKTKTLTKKREMNIEAANQLILGNY
jgi:hypothetical protein